MVRLLAWDGSRRGSRQRMRPVMGDAVRLIGNPEVIHWSGVWPLRWKWTLVSGLPPAHAPLDRFEPRFCIPHANQL